MQTNSLPRLEILAAKISLLILSSAVIAAVVVRNFPWLFFTQVSREAIISAAALAALNSLSWVTICLGLFIANNLKILYFLLGSSFKTLVILLVVQQLKTGGEGYLQLQAVIYFLSLTIMLLATGFLYNRLFGFLSEEIVNNNVRL